MDMQFMKNIFGAELARYFYQKQLSEKRTNIVFVAIIYHVDVLDTTHADPHN